MISAIHGFTGSPACWQSFADGEEIQALTVLGHGEGALACGDETFAGEVDRLIEQLPRHCEHLLGYSLGARLSLAIAIRQPQRIGKLTLIGVQPGLASEEQRHARMQSDQSWIDLLRGQGIEAFVKAWQALPMWQSQEALPEAVRIQQREQRLRHEPTQLAHALRSLGTGAMPPLWQELAQLSMPVTLVVGAQDHKFLEIAETMISHLPRAQLRVIDKAGHNPLLEQPAALRTFVLHPKAQESWANGR